MGLNAYFAYQIVGRHGSGSMSYELALTAVFIEGFVFIALSLIGMRQWLVKIIPESLKVASACGIGLFLAEIGLSSNAGIGAISGSTNTPLQLAGCPDFYKDEVTGFCVSHRMTSPSVSLAGVWRVVLGSFLLTFWTDVAWDHVRRCSNRLPDGIQSQKRNDCGNPPRLHCLVAVSTTYCAYS